MHRSRLATVLGLSTALVVLSATIAYGLVDLTPVVTGKGEQYRAFANDDYLVYTQWSRASGNTAFAKPVGGSRSKINATGTGGVVGGFDPTTNKVLYQQYTRRRSALYFYDLDTDQRSQPAGVNSKRWEWGPLISSRFIVFGRDRVRRGKIYTSLVVHNRTTDATRVLGTWRWGPYAMFPGSAGETYVAYTLCKKTCFAKVYDWDTKSTVKIPTVNGKSQYAPVVDEANGAVYFSRSANSGCGKHVDIWRRPFPINAAETATRIIDIPRGIDTGWESSLTLNGTSGEMDLYIERYDCRKQTGDVYVGESVSGA